MAKRVNSLGIDELLVDIEAARKQAHSTPQRLAGFFSVVAVLGKKLSVAS